MAGLVKCMAGLVGFMTGLVGCVAGLVGCMAGLMGFMTGTNKQQTNLGIFFSMLGGNCFCQSSAP